MINKRVNQGELIPGWYGVAWVDYERMQAVCYPIPLNIIIAIMRRCLFFLVNPRLLLPGKLEAENARLYARLRQLEDTLLGYYAPPDSD